MSVLIKGMKMPARCELCPFSGISGISCELISCTFTGKHRLFNDGQYLEDCPLVEVPPHGDLIEEEPIIKYITDGLNSGRFGYDAIEVLAEIKYAPTIIEAEEGE